MGNKCAPLMLLKLGDSDKVLSDCPELGEAVCAINHASGGFPAVSQRVQVKAVMGMDL